MIKKFINHVSGIITSKYLCQYLVSPKYTRRTAIQECLKKTEDLRIMATKKQKNTTFINKTSKDYYKF